MTAWMWMTLAAASTVVAVRLAEGPTVRRPARVRRSDPPPLPSASLVLGMMAVAIRQGASIPVALDAVGAAVGGSLGARMRRVSRSLLRGVGWDEAWLVPCAEGATGAGREKDESACMRLLRDALADSWRHGASPVPALRTAVETADREGRAAIERHASKLSVRLLVPTGLCFLPAFIAIGVIPSVASFL